MRILTAVKATLEPTVTCRTLLSVKSVNLTNCKRILHKYCQFKIENREKSNFKDIITHNIGTKANQDKTQQVNTFSSNISTEQFGKFGV